MTYTEGSFSIDDNGHAQFTGIDKNALNIVASTATLDGDNESFADKKNGTAVTLIHVQDVHDSNAYPLWTRTLDHEIAHQFLGHVFQDASFFGERANETSADFHAGMQAAGVSQGAYREGLEPRRYAAPLNPEATKPQK